MSSIVANFILNKKIINKKKKMKMLIKVVNKTIF